MSKLQEQLEVFGPDYDPEHKNHVYWTARKYANPDYRLEWCFTVNLPVDGRSPGVEVTDECDHAQVVLIRIDPAEDTE